MALPKIYLGSNVIIDGDIIASAIGSEAASSLTFSDLASIITNDKTTLVQNLNQKGLRDRKSVV